MARTAGLGKDAVQRKDRLRSEKTQRRLREMVEETTAAAQTLSSETAELATMIGRFHTTLKPDERVNENGLSQRLGVSRGPIREACSALAAMGLIEIIPNRGFFIRAPTNEEAKDLSEARACVFGCMAMMLAERITDEEIASLRALTDRMDEIVALGDVHVYDPVNLAFHKRIAVMAGNDRLETIYGNFVRELHIQRYRALASHDVLHISNEEHKAIVDALASRDPVRSLVAARSHIRNGIERTQQAGRPARGRDARAQAESGGGRRSRVGLRDAEAPRPARRHLRSGC